MPSGWGPPGRRRIIAGVETVASIMAQANMAAVDPANVVDLASMVTMRSVAIAMGTACGAKAVPRGRPGLTCRRRCER